MKLPISARRLSLGVFGKNSSQIELSNAEENAHEEVVEGEEIIEYLTQSRGFWHSKLEFILAGIAYSVGVGNIWRFPQKVLSNGDGLFFIPYVVMNLALGMPLVYLEATMAQFSKSNLINVWRCCPLFKGVGYSMLFLCTIMHTFYPVIMSYALIYAAYSFAMIVSQSESLPWVTCPGSACGPPEKVNSSTQSRAELFWEQSVIMKEDLTTFFDLGSFSIQVSLGLLLTWFMAFFSVRNGIDSTKKSVFIIVPMTGILLVILLVRALTLPGASIGLYQLIPTDFDQLWDESIWKNAADQTMFSLGISYGGMIVLSSYNSFHNTIHRDAVIVTSIDMGCSFAATLIMYCVMGTYALETGTDFGATVKKNSGTPFVTYSEALSRMVFPGVWSFLFFTMLFLVGLASSFQTILAHTTTLKETFEVLNHPRVPLTAIVCFCLFLLGLPLTTSRGSNFVEIIDFYGVGFPLLVVGLVETVGFCYIYGIYNISKDNHMMEGDKNQASFYYRIVWVLCPLTILALVVFYVTHWEVPYQEDGQLYPDWTPIFGYTLMAFTIAPIVVGMIWQVAACLARGESLGNVLTPEASWGPAIGRGCCEGCRDQYRQKSQIPDTLTNEYCRKKGVLCVSLRQVTFDGLLPVAPARF